MYKLIIFEGVDNLGKTTLINQLKQKYKNHLIVKFSSPPSNLSLEEKLKYQYTYFEEKILEVINNNLYDIIIWDRSHIGEMIYSPLFRNYCTVLENLELELKYKDFFRKNVALIYLQASPKFSYNNDDGKSLCLSDKQIQNFKKNWKSIFKDTFDLIDLFEFNFESVIFPEEDINLIFTRKIERQLFKIAIKEWTIIPYYNKLILDVDTIGEEFRDIEELKTDIFEFIENNETLND